jgi:hypothetical protein
MDVDAKNLAAISRNLCIRTDADMSMSSTALSDGDGSSFAGRVCTALGNADWSLVISSPDEQKHNTTCHDPRFLEPRD